MMPVSVDGLLVIIGTSAGPVAGADITCGQEPQAPYQAQFGGCREPEPAARIGWSPVGRLAWMNTSRDPVRGQARIGCYARVREDASHLDIGTVMGASRCMNLRLCLVPAMPAHAASRMRASAFS